MGKATVAEGGGREVEERGRRGVGWGGEGSSTGHQLLSDYIIPDIKTTHTARVPAGGPERRAGAESGPASPPSQFPLSPRARSRPRKWGPMPALPWGRTPQRYPPARPPEDSKRGQLPGSPAGRPGGGGGKETAARGPAAGAALRWGPGGCLRSILAASRGASPATYLRGAQAPEPIHMVLSPPSSGAAEAAPVAPRRAREPVGLPRAPKGRRRVSPTRRPDPSLARAAAAGRCSAAGGFVCARGALGARGEAPRAGMAEDARLRGQPRLCYRGRRAGLSGLRLAATPPPLPRQPPPHPLGS